MTDSHKGLLLGFLGVAIFSLSLPATRIAVIDLPPAFVTAVRLAGAGLLSAAFLAFHRSAPPRREEAGLFAAVIAGVVIGFPFFSALAMETVDSSHGGVVLALLPLCTAIAAMAFGGERPSAVFFLWAALGTLTVLAFVLYRSHGGIAAGDLFLVLAAAFASMGYAAGGALARRRAGLEVISWALFVSLPISLPAAWLTAPPDLTNAGGAAWAGTVYATVFAQFAGFYFFYRGLALGGIARVGQIQLLQVYMTMAAGAILLGEQIDPAMLGAALLTMLFVWLGRNAQVR
ncbi:MAG: DMT family transporter [Geminicoccaceae bacterium]